MLPAMKWFVNGGSLWWYDEITKEWFMHNNEELGWYHQSNFCYIIEDKYFEERKQYALGEIIECRLVNSVNERDWRKCIIPLWLDAYSYRVRKEPVYEWQWYDTPHLNEVYELSKEHWTETEVNNISWTKFEPSKRVRK